MFSSFSAKPPAWHIIMICLLLCGGMHTEAFATPPPPPAPVRDAPPVRPLAPGVRWVTPDEAENAIQTTADIQIVDVRSKEEHVTHGRIAYSRHLDAMNSKFSEYFPTMAKERSKLCLIYCSLGARSQRAAEKASALGYRNIIIIQGGYLAWRKAGKPIVK